MSEASSRYPPLGVAVDIVLFTVVDRQLEVLLTRRHVSPFENLWSLPGGFVGARESADEAARRELLAKSGVSGVFLEQLFTFSDPNRDPRSRVVSVAYYALVSADRLPDRSGSREARWFWVGTRPDGSAWYGEPDQVTPLAFDHDQILQTALERIRGKLEYVPIGFQLLPSAFTLTELQQVYEAVLGHEVDKRNFRARIRRSGLVRELEEYRTGAHRPARLYAFTKKTF